MEGLEPLKALTVPVFPNLARRAFPLTLSVLLTLATGSIAIAQTDTSAFCGKLASFSGRVDILRVQKEGRGMRHALVSVANGMQLRCDDVIVVDKNSGATLELNGAKLALAPETRIEIAEAVERRPVRIDLSYGKMRAAVKSLKPNTPTQFRIKTHSAVVGVRGTDFYASYDPVSDRTEQATLTGKVEVQASATQESVQVQPGEQVIVEENSLNKLQVQPISDSVKIGIRGASAIAKTDTVFVTSQAESLLGPSDQWTYKQEEIPERLKNIKNEY